MSINRDESTLGKLATPAASHPVAPSVLTLQKAKAGLATGVYFGRLEDIKLLCDQADITNADDFRIDRIEPLFLGVVMEGAFRCYRNVHLVSHAGFREGLPLFDIDLLRVDHCKRVDSSWWVIPMWIACRLGFVNTSLKGNKTPFTYDLRQVKG